MTDVLEAIWAGVSEKTGFSYGYVANSVYFDKSGLDIVVSWCEDRVLHDQDGFSVHVSGGENGYSSGYSTSSFLKHDLADPDVDPEVVVLSISLKIKLLVMKYWNNV